MARPGYTEPSTIGAYIAQLEPDLFGRSRMRRRIADEVRDHLEESVQRYLERGLSPNDAQHRAIEDFGPRHVVINSWAESKGIGVVTKFTRFGGLAGIIGAIGLSLSMAYADISWSFSIGWFAEVALAFGAFLTIGMVALYVRLRGKLGRYARVGFRMIIAGIAVGFGSSMLWFAPGGVVAILLLITGVALYLVGAYRAHVVPNAVTVLWGIAFLFSVVVGVAGTVSGTDTGLLAASTGYALFSLGWIRLGTHLWTEVPPAEALSASLFA